MDSKSKPFAHQDWSEDFFMPKKSTAKTTQKKVADAMKSGGGVIATKKGTANKKGPGISIGKEMASQQIKDPGHVSHEISVAILKARQDKGWKQSDLAKVMGLRYKGDQAINEKAGVVVDYENGKAVPSGAMIAKMEKALGCKLPRPKKAKAVKKKKDDWTDDDW